MVRREDYTVIVTYLKVISRHLHRQTEKNHEKSFGIADLSEMSREDGKFTCFSTINYHVKFQNPTLGASGVAPTSEVHTAVVMLFKC
jgi:hypothetical protein